MENANGVIKKLTSAERSYYTAAEVREGNAGCSDQRIWQDNSSVCFQERRREGKSFADLPEYSICRRGHFYFFRNRTL